MSASDGLQRNLPVIGTAVRNIIIFTAVLSIPLAAAQALGLSPAETSGWIMAVYGLPAVLSLILTIRYRQPLLLTGNIFVIIFIERLGGNLGYAELIGAAIVAGAAVLLIGLLGLTERLAAWVPAPVVFALLAGAVLPLLTAPFTALGEAPLVVGGTVLAYLASRRVLGDRVPAILPALVVGIAIVALSGQFGPLPEPLAATLPRLTMPVFSWGAILTAAPVFVVLITLQANLPSVRFLQSQGYAPPETVIDIISGVGTMLASLLGPSGISLSLPATSVVAGPGAGEHEIRHRSIYIAGSVALLVGLLAGIAVGLAGTVPLTLLVTLAGLALIGVLGHALRQATAGPLLLGPLFAFLIAVSQISFLGFGPSFWSLLVGTGISWLLEGDALRATREGGGQR